MDRFSRAVEGRARRFGAGSQPVVSKTIPYHREDYIN
jgi:hypothetical protein